MYILFGCRLALCKFEFPTMTDKFDKAKILLIDDNPSDVRIFIEVLRECGLNDEVLLTNISDSDKAIAYLKEGNERPDLILLDVNLPRKNGIEVLSEIKNNLTLRPIPIVIMTTSDREKDIKTAYENYANSYIIKPAEIAEFVDVIQSLYRYWFKIVRLKF